MFINKIWIVTIIWLILGPICIWKGIERNDTFGTIAGFILLAFGILFLIDDLTDKLVPIKKKLRIKIFGKDWEE